MFDSSDLTLAQFSSLLNATSTTMAAATLGEENSSDTTVSPCPVVQRFMELLDQRPTEFDIAILSEKESENVQDAIVLQSDTFLGVNALNLPYLARDVRHDYWECRKKKETLENVTKCLLLLCPDHATAWADRRRHLLRLLDDTTSSKQRQEALRDELDFLNLLMTKHTKAPSSWSHRQWVLARLMEQDNVSLDDLIQKELALCTMVAERYPKNYYSWTHRLYCMRKARQLSLLQEEWDACLAWLPQHVSDHSAVHYGGQVLLQILELNTNNGFEVVENDMREGKRLVELHPAHEVLWIFRRVCAHAMLLLLKDKNEACDTTVRDVLVKHIEDEWMEIQETQRPKIGSELELEWRKTHVYRLSYIAWVARKSQLVSKQIRERSTDALNECVFIPYNMWRGRPVFE